MTQIPNSIAPVASPVFDTLCALVAHLPDTEVIQHEHLKIHDIPGRPKKNNFYYIFSYREDFSKLWMEIDQESRVFEDIFDWSSSTKSYSTIIVWDGYPPQNNTNAIPIENWVTPIDWAVCAALNALRKAKQLASADSSRITEFLPEWSVLIVDLVSQNYSGSQSVSLIKANPALIPWLRIYRPAIPAGESELNELDNILVGKDIVEQRYALLRAMTKDDFTSLVEDIRTPERILGLKACHNTLEALASIWTANIVRPGDRHQVANLVAPLILVEALKNRANPSETLNLERSVSNSMTLALTEQLKSLELMALPTRGSGNKRDRAIRSVRDDLNILTDNQIDFQIYLIDDQYRMGYSDILDFVVGIPNKITCCDSAVILFDELKNAFGSITINTPGWRKPLFTKKTILLLDLRLWYDTYKEQLVSFHGALKDIGTLYENKIKEPFEERRCGTKTVLDEQRKAWADDWAIVKSNITDHSDREDLLALTILPRLLSIVDPFLPIILFSSAAQRQTLEAFEGYSNIITDFRKPMPIGYGDKLNPIEYIEDLALSFKKASEICRLNFIGRYISELEKKLFIDGYRIMYDKFKNAATLSYDVEIVFDPVIVTADLRVAAMHLLQGDYRFSTMLPFSLMERWYTRATNNIFENVMPNTDYWSIADPRNDYVHGDIFCLEKKSTDIDTAIAVWNAFLSLLRVEL